MIFYVNYCRWIIGASAQSCLSASLECGLFFQNCLQSSGMKNFNKSVSQTLVLAPLMVPSLELFFIVTLTWVYFFLEVYPIASFYINLDLHC